MRARYTGPAMTLENMRSIGVRSIEAGLAQRAFIVRIAASCMDERA
jgi:hypothetical protein